MVCPVPAPPQSAEAGEAFAPAPASTINTADIPTSDTAATPIASFAPLEASGMSRRSRLGGVGEADLGGVVAMRDGVVGVGERDVDRGPDRLNLRHVRA